MKITRLVYLLIGCLFFTACDQYSLHDYNYNEHKKLHKYAFDTFSFKSTYHINEKGEYYTVSRCHDSEKGCEIKGTISFISPTTPGIYWIRNNQSKEKSAYPIYVIDPSQVKPCLLISTFTSQAYSKVGGYSFYQSRYEAPITVSMNRPLRTSQFIHGYGHPVYELFHDLDIDIHVIDDLYLHENNMFLQSKCSYLVFSQHSEYWSTNMSSNILEYIKSGNNILNLSGNSAYWNIRVEKELNNIKINVNKLLGKHRLEKNHPEIKDIFGIYYAGYPLGKKAKNSTVFNEKFPNFLPNSNSHEYEDLRVIKVLDKDHIIFSCLEKGKLELNDDALKIELDGKIISEYNAKTKKTIVNPIAEIQGRLLSGWSVYGAKLRNIVLARDYINEYGGRVLSIGSIGWSYEAMTNIEIRNITKLAIASFSGIDYQCE